MIPHLAFFSAFFSFFFCGDLIKPQVFAQLLQADVKKLRTYISAANLRVKQDMLKGGLEGRISNPNTLTSFVFLKSSH